MWGNKESQNNKEENNKGQKNQKKDFNSLWFNQKVDNFLKNFNIDKIQDINESLISEKRDDFLKSDSLIKDSFYELDDDKKDEKLKAIIKKKLQINFIERDNLISWLQKTIEWNYLISDNKKWENLKKLIQKETVENIKKISLFKSMQEKFLLENKIFYNANDILYKNDSTDKIAEILWSIATKLLNDNDLDDNKIKVLEFINSFSSLNLIHESHIEAILSYMNENKLKDEANLLLRHYISKISLKNLNKYQILSSEEVEQKKAAILKKYEHLNLKITSKDLDESNIFLDDFWDISKVSETDLAFLIIDDINSFKLKIISDNYNNWILSKLETKWLNDDINDSFIDYIEKNPLTWVNWIKNLKDNNFVVLETKKPDWSLHRIIQKIEKVDVWHSIESKAIKLTNYTSAYWVLSTSSDTKTYFYDDFYEFLKIPSQANENWEQVKIYILTEKEYAHYLKWETKKEDWTYEKTQSEIKKVDTNEWVSSLSELKTKVDIIDPNWSSFDITNPCKTTFVAWKPWDKHYWHFSILNINQAKWEITLSSKDYKTWKNETISYDTFLQAFESKDAKRWEFIWEKTKFVDHFLKMKSFDWKFEFKDGKLFEKSEKWEKPRKLEYLANSNWKAIKIEEFWSDYVSISTWELEEKKDGKTFKLSYPTRVTYEDFYNHINDVKSEKDEYKAVLQPKNEKDDDIRDPKRWFSIWKKLFSFYCMSDIVSWLKMLPNLVEDYLKQWSSIRSAKLALALWKNLPDAVRLQLQAKVESEEKKAVEDLVWKWIWLDSTKFIPRIEKVIKDRASEDYEIEAAMISILKKYWKLYRWDLSKYNGTFIWYRSLWGVPNDALYKDTKESCEKNWIPFTEELLLEELLKIQSKPLDDSKRVKYWIKKQRRSKFGKEFGNYIWTWIKEELADWKNKTEWMLSPDWVIDYALWEIGKLAHNNWLWAMDVVWEKWWDVHLMNMIPHIINSTWLSMSLWTSTLKNLKDKAYWKPYPALAFLWNKSDIELYRNVSKKLVDRMNISNEDKQLFYNSINDSKTEVDKIAAAKKFYQKHWKELTKKLMINQDPIIFLEKDKDSDFKQYFDKLSSVYWSNDYSIEKKWIENWVYNYDAWLPFLTWWLWFLFKTYSINTEKKSPWNLDTKILNWEITTWFKEISKLKLNLEDKKKMFEQYFQTTETLISSALWGKLSESKQDWRYPFLDKMRKSVFIELYYDNREDWYQNTAWFKSMMENQWLKYKSKFIDENVVEEKTESKFAIEKKLKENIETEVFDILSWNKKIVPNNITNTKDTQESKDNIKPNKDKSKKQNFNWPKK